MIKQRSTIDMVREFHEKFEHLIADEPCIPSEETNNFRADFMKEESLETAKACLEGDLIELADGLGDLQYVLDGWFLNAGLASRKNAIVAEIHRSNLTKLCKDERSAKDSIDYINARCEKGDEASYRPQHDFFVVYRIRDNKIEKSIYYEKPNLFPIIHDVIKDDEPIHEMEESVSPGPFGSLHLGRGGFGQAISALKEGRQVARAGWNGKAMYLLMIESGGYGINAALGKLWADLSTDENTDAQVLLPWIGMKTADNKFVPWLASQSDMLAEDWDILE